jgi:PKD repeat protein
MTYQRRFATLITVLLAAVSLARAQTSPTPQAYVMWETNYCPGGACNQDYPGEIATFVVTPWGWTAGPNDEHPTWSADGKQIAFTRNFDIYVMDATLSPLNITNTGNNADPAWSPDGARIAFGTGRAGQPELYLMDPDGSNVVRVTYNVGFIGHPAWSPDNKRIAFDCQVDAGNDDICAINSDGTGFTRLTTDPAVDSSPTWSPDTQTIAFYTGRYATGSPIAVMNADGSNVSQVNSPTGGGDLAWSPDGAQIAFDVPEEALANAGYYVPDIYLMQADGTNVGLFQKSAGEPAWMPMRVPVATFTVSCAGFSCTFNASGSKDSYGTISSYAWNFGDGAIGAGATLVHTYTANGNYSVKLNVADSNDATGTKFQTITVNLAASFTFSCNALTCNFDGSASKDSNATITSYAWNFGDGLTGAGVIISHMYAVGNSYKVTLTITDSTGATDAQSQTVDNNFPPVASFTFTCNLLTCSFNGSGSRDYDGTITSYSWNFGDGTAASGPTVTHTYAAGGQYTVTLTVTDNAGATNAQSQTVVANSPPVASFTFSCSRFTCSFDASGSYDRDGNITTWTWNFGDGTTLTGSYEWVGHTYPAPGTYTVTLTVTDNGGATGRQSNSVTVVRRK